MRIMYLLFSFSVGGTERLIVDICNEMIQQQYEVHLYIINNLYDKALLQELDNKVKINLQNRPVGSGKQLQTIKCITNYIRENHINVVHCNSFNSPELLILKPLFFKNVKIVHTTHGLGQYENLSRWKIILRNQLCNNFIAISDSVKNDMIQHKINTKKIRVVYNAINLEKFNVKENKIFNLDKIIIGNVARFMPEIKGQDILINALVEVKKKYPNIICYFAGGYDESHKKVFKKMQSNMKEMNMEENIKFIGNVNDIPQFLNTLDIFVLPSRLEGFGISLIEAMATGLPCIASNLNGPAEIIGNNERGLLFKLEDSQDLADKIITVIQDYKFYKKKTKENIKYINTYFNIKSMCNHLIEIYKGD